MPRHVTDSSHRHPPHETCQVHRRQVNNMSLRPVGVSVPTEHERPLSHQSTASASPKMPPSSQDASPCMSYVSCAMWGVAMPLRSEQSGGDAMYLFFRACACVRVCAVLCVCTFMCVRATTTSSSRARLRRHVCRMCRVRRQQFITCRVVVSWCVWAHDHEGLRAMMSPISLSRARLP